MKRFFWLWFLTTFIVIGLVSVSMAQDNANTCTGVALMDGWVRPSRPGANNSAVYGRLINLGEEDDTLLGVTTRAAEVAELHEVLITDADTMKMQPREGGFPVAARNFARLEPGAWHIMLINLTDMLVVGDTIDLTLEFENAGLLEVTVPVREVDGMGDMGGGSMMGMMGGSVTSRVIIEGCDSVQVLRAYVRPTVMAGGTTAAYGLIVNPSATDDALLSVTTDVAGMVELHEMLVVNETMQMRPIEGGIAVESGHSACLKPGSMHIMMMDVQMLEEGDTVEITFTFEQAGDIVLTVPVQPPPEDMMAMEDGGM